MKGSGIFTFDAKQYPFDIIIAECIRRRLAIAHLSDNPLCVLSRLHEFANERNLDDIFVAIYDLFVTERFAQPYNSLCEQIIKEKFGDKAAYQRVPSVRIQMPGQTSVNYHTDEWYGHGHDVQNFWLPLTPVAETNSLYVSDEQTSLGVTETIRTVRHSIEEMNQLARRACRPLKMRFGEVYHFNSHIIHGTEKNNTDQTRVSFDFRMLREGDDRGLKDESFFVPFGKGASFAGTGRRTGIVYIGKRRGFTNIISQKYQSLLCRRYAAENQISVLVEETELSGFNYLPALWNMVSGSYVGRFSDLIIFSIFLLPESAAERHQLAEECRAKDLTLHFVAEDIVTRPETMLEQINAGYRQCETSN